MRDAWLKLASSVVRPHRPQKDRCLLAREAHLEARRVAADMRMHAIARCTARIEAARAEVFAANDGVVRQSMTELEREWRRLSRVDLDGGLMDLWAQVAPAHWVDRKRFRDSAPAARLDAVVALASDPAGVEAAEAAALAFRATLAVRGVAIGERLRWRPFTSDDAGLRALLPLLDAPREWALSQLDGTRPPPEKRREESERFAREIADRVQQGWPGRDDLARCLGAAAQVDFLWQRASLPKATNPATPLRNLWSTGYALADASADGMTLAFPDL